MEENAPAEWDVVNQRYQEVLTPLNPPPGPVIENWRTIPQRVDDHYDSLFQGLELLPDDALTLQEFFGSSHDDAQASLLSEQATLQAEPPVEAQRRCIRGIAPMKHLCRQRRRYP